MIESTSQKIIVVLGVITALATLGYFLYNGAEIPTTEADLANQQILGQDIILLSEKLNNVNINEDVFASPIFLSLIDRQIPLVTEEQGRPNPFAKIGIDGGLTTTLPNGKIKPPLLP